ncbi:hypothetical protein VNO80_02060 [Phaseolus coccineus]|uniref:Uncharacterized protein n=1 Tax=Phaseolus coccineus TaxID=3886 RepID=A0AAN9NPJ3_PHACN
MRKFKDCEKHLELTKVLAKDGGHDEDMVEMISYEINLMSKQLAELEDNLKYEQALVVKRLEYGLVIVVVFLKSYLYMSQTGCYEYG